MHTHTAAPALFAAIAPPSMNANAGPFAKGTICSVAIMLANTFALAILAIIFHLPMTAATSWVAKLATVLEFVVGLTAFTAEFARMALLAMNTNFSATAVLALRFDPAVRANGATTALLARNSHFSVLTNAAAFTILALAPNSAMLTNAAAFAVLAHVSQLTVLTIRFPAAALSAARLLPSVLAKIASTARFAVTAHFAVLAHAAAAASCTRASHFTVVAVAAPAASLAAGPFFLMGADRASFAIDTIAANFLVLAQTFAITVSAQPLQPSVPANTTTPAFLAL